MAYIGTQPKDVRSFGKAKFDFTATQGQTAFTGADDDGKTLGFTDGQINVYVNGILMDDSDYSTSGSNTVTLSAAANANDIISVVALQTDIPNSDYVPATGGTFSGGVTFDSWVGVGTNSPQTELHLNDTTGLSRIRLTGGAADSDNFEFGQGTTGVTNGGFEIRDIDASATRFVINNNGHVGVGLPAAPSVLSIRGAGSEGTLRVIPQAANSEASIGFYQDTLGTNYTSRWVAGCGGWGQTGHFTIGNSSTYKMRITTGGVVTKPYQPYFLANNYGQAKAAGWQQVVFTTYVEHNVGNHYSASNSRFTAPIAGVYLFSVGGYIPANNSTERYAFAFHVNNNGGAYIGGGTQASIDAPIGTLTQAIKLNANDYVTVMMYTPNAETLGASFHRMWFNGYLLG